LDTIGAGIGDECVQQTGALLIGLGCLAAVCRQHEEHSTLRQEGYIAGWVCAHGRSLLAGCLDLYLVGNEFPYANHFIAIGTETRMCKQASRA
jgi:hypothetical protein